MTLRERAEAVFYQWCACPYDGKAAVDAIEAALKAVRDEAYAHAIEEVRDQRDGVISHMCARDYALVAAAFDGAVHRIRALATSEVGGT